MSKRTSVVLLALAVSCSTAVVLADSKIEYKATEGGGSSLNTVLIGQGKVRSDADQNTSVVLDPAAASMTILDHGKKTFTRIGRPELQQLIDLVKQMDEMMASLPPEARADGAEPDGGAGGARRP